MIYPLCASLWLSLSNKGASGGPHFVGLENYHALFSQEKWARPFWNALQNNVLFFLIHMLVQNPIGLLLATLLGARIRGAWIYRTILFTPTILSGGIIGCLWKVNLDPALGISRSLLQTVGVVSLDNPWLGLESTALVTL